MKILVAAGGQGTKIWPLSRKSLPKQFQKIIGDQSIFTTNIKMLLTKYAPEDIYISTKKMYENVVRAQASDIPKKNFILEPDTPLGRGPGEGFAFLHLALSCPDEPFSIIQADCLYLPEKTYLKTLDVLEKAVKKDKKLISGGLVPDFPVIGVDYLALGNKTLSKDGVSVYKVEKFLGRTTYDETVKMIKEKNVVIHTNLNTWYPELMLDAYKEYRPDWYEKLMEIKMAIQAKKSHQVISRIFNDMKPGSTEEVTKHVFEQGYIITFSFKWVDIGTWDSVYQHVSSGENVHTEGNVVALESKGSLIKSTNPEKLVAVMGLSDMIVVDTEDILFIAPRDRVGNIKAVHDALEQRGLEKYL